MVQGSRQGEGKGRGPGQVKMEEVSDSLNTGKGLSWHLNAVRAWPCAKLLLKFGKLREEELYPVGSPAQR